jgi:hypothetical protein
VSVHAAVKTVQTTVRDGVRRVGPGRTALGLAALGAMVGLSTVGAVVTPGAASAADRSSPEGTAASAEDAGASAEGALAISATAVSLDAALSDALSAGDAGTAGAASAALPDAAKVPSYEGLLQPNWYYCGPAATRIALTAHGYVPSFDDLARALGTTTAGTASIFEVTRVLNDVHGYERYESVELSHRGATGAQVKRLRHDVMKAINEGDPVVANVIGTITDTAGEVHSYNGGHYVAITGYSDRGELITVTDPADRVGSNEYQVPLRVMADWISSRGYSA